MIIDNKYCSMKNGEFLEIQRNLGFELMKIRIKNNKSQANVRKDLGIDISHFERGVRFPRIDTLLRICNYYEIPVCYLFARIEFPENYLKVSP